MDELPQFPCNVEYRQKRGRPTKSTKKKNEEEEEEKD